MTQIAEVHAHKQAEVINMLVEEQMITKADIKNLETEMKLGFADVRHQLADIRTTIENIDKKFEHKFEVQDEKIEQRFKVQDEKMEQRFKMQDEKIEQRFKMQDEKIEQHLKVQDERIEHRLTNLETSLRHDMKIMSNTLLIRLSVLMGGIIGLLNFLHRFQVI